MAIVQYTAKVKEGRLLELPEEAMKLGLKPGEEVQVSLDQKVAPTETVFPPNEGMLAVLREIAERQKDRPYTDGSDSMRLLREARAGAMYDRDPVE